MKELPLIQIGTSEIKTTRLCFGCAAAFGRNLITDERAIKVFKTAYEEGIRFFDTGHSYGLAESRIGKALKELDIPRDSITISTKFGARKINGKTVLDFSPSWVKESLEISLVRMGLDYVDIYSVYSPRLSDLTPELYACLEELKRSGKIRSIGLVAYGDDLIRKAVNEGPFDIVMINYNIARQEKEPFIHELAQLGKSVIAGQALGEGVFLKSLFHPKSKKDIWYLARTLLRKSSRVLYKKAKKYRFLNEYGEDAIKIALKYVLNNPDISCAVFGSVDVNHIKSNSEAPFYWINQELLKRLKSG